MIPTNVLESRVVSKLEKKELWQPSFFHLTALVNTRETVLIDDGFHGVFDCDLT